MTNKPKGLGTELETALKRWLIDNGWPYADRITLRGPDEGDVRLSERIPFVLEGKSAKRSTERATLGAWMRELEVEVTNAGAIAGAVVHKKRGTTNVGDYYAIMPVHMLNTLLRLAFPEAPPTQSPEATKPTPLRRRRVIPRYDT